MDRSSRAGPSRSVTTTRIRLFLSGSTTSTSWPANGPEYTRTRAPGTNCTDTASRHHGGTSTASCTCVMAGLLPRLLPLGASTWHDTEPHPFDARARSVPDRGAGGGDWRSPPVTMLAGPRPGGTLFVAVASGGVFQAGYAGSIPVTRSTALLLVSGPRHGIPLASSGP